MARAALAYPPLERKEGEGSWGSFALLFPLLESYLWLKEEGALQKSLPTRIKLLGR
jgi:hypothetical protein